jgi:hypothetical protein
MDASRDEFTAARAFQFRKMCVRGNRERWGAVTIATPSIIKPANADDFLQTAKIELEGKKREGPPPSGPFPLRQSFRKKNQQNERTRVRLKTSKNKKLQYFQ